MTAIPENLVSLKVDSSDHVAEVTLLGPGKGNAMGPDFWRELPLVFGALDADPAVRAVVLTGSGPHFSYGLDLPAMAPKLFGDGAAQGPRLLAEIHILQDSVTAVAACRKPVIAAADIRLASADAKFSVREVKLAIVADLGSLQRLAGIIGEGHLRELAFTGKDVDATHAARIGLVNTVYPDQDSTLAAARDLAAEIASNSPLAVQGVKDVLNSDRESTVAAGLRYVAARNATVLPSKDLTEAVQAFLERRAPTFTGE
ncbi:MAG TPA: crotonase/enoyl-CoA hydratase family protein [Actinophytocola sp.]|nr:crotonase/enoyl-CoA hydratase family protein [Actinophytocola sp.]HEV2781244.1 crotonase/enoyl-CoA hydratase family protein [Actinophytocola sp.]